MKNLSAIAIAVSALLFAGAASAQSPPAASGPNNNAVNSSDQKNSARPVAGANSFTEGQAKDRAIGHGGVDAVTGFKKDDDGIWRGTGTQAGKTVEIAVDYKGNVVSTAQQ